MDFTLSASVYLWKKLQSSNLGLMLAYVINGTNSVVLDMLTKYVWKKLPQYYSFLFGLKQRNLFALGHHTFYIFGRYSC